MKKLSKNAKIYITCFVAFVIWAVLAVFRTVNANPSWFDSVAETSVETTTEATRKEIETTDKQEFNYALAWSKYGDCWACVNIDGYAEIVLGSQYVKVTDFCNSSFAMVEDENGRKCLIDRAGNVIFNEYSYVCDKFITENFSANLMVATQKVEEDGETKTGYGLINESLGWYKPASTENEYLKEFTKGIDDYVLTTENEDKLYFAKLDKIIEDVDEIMYYNSDLIMYRKGTDIYLIDKSGENERVTMSDISKTGEWTEGIIYCELTDGTHIFKDINGTNLLDVTDLNIVNLPRFLDGYAGILMQTEEGTKYTVIDLEGNMMFEPVLGIACDTLTSKRFAVSYVDSETGLNVIKVIDENGTVIFDVNSSITNFTNGYAIKDGEVYVRADGTELIITK